jgi:hypothetical protein
MLGAVYSDRKPRLGPEQNSLGQAGGHCKRAGPEEARSRLTFRPGRPTSPGAEPRIPNHDRPTFFPKTRWDGDDRRHDVHLKNVTGPDKKGHAIELPRGAINLPAFVRALRLIKYAGMCSLEYEKDMTSPLPGLAECVGYFRGVMDAAA